ncbi:unnamed protein product [Lactuca virosa]|uniref:Uncharacterized protein n=1 Tax=Lactuca virosa TaxID=75947 RepID=A0AAU9P5X1_9ASTR|nr:unnamed protein product [Lactuca virosa]
MFAAGNWKKARFTAAIGESFFSDVGFGSVLSVASTIEFLSSTSSTFYLNKGNCVVEECNGLMVQPHKAIVGANAFDHETGIHQELNDLFWGFKFIVEMKKVIIGDDLEALVSDEAFRPQFSYPFIPHLETSTTCPFISYSQRHRQHLNRIVEFTFNGIAIRSMKS